MVAMTFTRMDLNVKKRKDYMANSLDSCSPIIIIVVVIIKIIIIIIGFVSWKLQTRLIKDLIIFHEHKVVTIMNNGF